MAAPSIGTQRPQTCQARRNSTKEDAPQRARPKSSMSIRTFYGNTTKKKPVRTLSASSTRSSTKSSTKAPVAAYQAPTALAHQIRANQAKTRKRNSTKRQQDKMRLVFHNEDNNTLRVKTCRWQSDFVTEKTVAPSDFRHRDFADEKDLTHFERYFHVDNSLAIQLKTAKNQADLRDIRPGSQQAELKGGMELVFRPLDPQESMGRTDTEKAFQKGVNKDFVDKHRVLMDNRKLQNHWGGLIDQFEDPKPRFTKYFRTIRPSDKLKDMGLQRGGYFLPKEPESPPKLLKKEFQDFD